MSDRKPLKLKIPFQNLAIYNQNNRFPALSFPFQCKLVITQGQEVQRNAVFTFNYIAYHVAFYVSCKARQTSTCNLFLHVHLVSNIKINSYVVYRIVIHIH